MYLESHLLEEEMRKLNPEYKIRFPFSIMDE